MTYTYGAVEPAFACRRRPLSAFERPRSQGLRPAQRNRRNGVCTVFAAPASRKRGWMPAVGLQLAVSTASLLIGSGCCCPFVGPGAGVDCIQDAHFGLPDRPGGRSPGRPLPLPQPRRRRRLYLHEPRLFCPRAVVQVPSLRRQLSLHCLASGSAIGRRLPGRRWQMLTGDSEFPEHAGRGMLSGGWIRGGLVRRTPRAH
jgi:hypothetical protein